VASYSILIADGDPDFIQYLSGTLKANGFKSAGTSAGANALMIYKNDAPDLVVVDAELADMTGLQLLENIRRYDPRAKMILTTTSAEKELIARAFRMGTLDVLEKPLEPEFLITKIRELIAREDRALEGNLQMMSLASIIQINCEERNLAQLSLHSPGKSGSIYFKDGEMIHAESGELSGEEAIYSLLGWESGTFQLKMGMEPGLRTIEKPWSGILLEGMRRIDESTAAWSPDWDQQLTEDQPAASPQVSLEEKIVKAIAALRDVESALICEKDGAVIAQSQPLPPEADPALGSYIREKADSIGGFLNGGALEWVVLSGSKKRIYLQVQDDHLILLVLAKRASAESIYEEVKTIHKRYR
jgi:CheY-like chemotaxis protein/predicted regulator of Ras-like GTPase activity (Roadblock/LC7/MglB family)